jgi:hypothetical protein
MKDVVQTSALRTVLRTRLTTDASARRQRDYPRAASARARLFNDAEVRATGIVARCGVAVVLAGAIISTATISASVLRDARE